jgi:hypothetical protein
MAKMMAGLSEYELERLNNIKRNAELYVVKLLLCVSLLVGAG